MKYIRRGVPLAAACLIVACGQVITLTPTPTAAPTATIAVALAEETDEPTATPAPYTPAPTATATLTPTPVFHTVQSGESLLTVSNLYGVSVADLQEVNGILDPRTLQIGQQLIIPSLDELDAPENSTPTPTAMPVEIKNLHFSETAVGGLWVLGEVHNMADIALEQVRVGVSLVDEAGSELSQIQGLVALDLVDIDESAPFALLFEVAPPVFDRYLTYPVSAVPAYVGSYYRDLTVENLTSESERYASYTVSGIVRNLGPEEAVSVQVVLTAYDPLQRVVAMRKVIPEYNVVPRGGETSFTAVLAPVGGPVERIEATAQGRRLLPDP